MNGIIDRPSNRAFWLVVIFALLGAAVRKPRGPLSNNSDKLPRLVQNFIAVWNSRDPGAVDRVFAVDIVLQNVPEETAHTGRDAVKAYLEELVTWAPDLQMTVRNHHVTGRWAVVEWKWSGTLHGDFSTELNISGKSFSVPGVSILQLRGGRVVRCTSYHDATAMLHQLEGRVIFPPL